ncbi:hypothetical protein Taro_016296 [Colocasia esculenta]|uniref:Uncharacterized protein n=1 Tax=Colocasia esculenta TaxID=4460 RepID=A0A843UNF9_COLES|nr:hypothetical protein [Colocasia esculenta]
MPTVDTSSVGSPMFCVSQARECSGLVPVFVYRRACSWLGVTDTSRRTGPQLVMFPVPHFRKLRPESLKVPGMGLRLCGPQEWCWLVWCWLVYFVCLWSCSWTVWSVATRLRGGSCVLLSGLDTSVMNQ